MKKLMLILFFLPLIGFGQFLPMKMNIIDGRDIKQCDDGGFIIVGDIRIRNQNGSSVLQGSLLKTDRNGNLIWKKPIAKPSGLGSLNSVQVSDDGGFIVAGKGWGIGVSHLLKTDGNGNILWKKEFKGGGKSDIKSLQILDDGGFIVAGMSDADAYLFKTDRNGNLLWEKKFEFEEFSYNEYTEVANSVQICDDGGFIVTGNVVRNDRRYIRASFLFKTDRNGNLIWKRKFPSSIANSVQICNDGGFIVAGTAFKIFPGNSTATTKAYLLKTDSNGNLIWEKKFSALSKANSLQVSDDGGFIVAGKSSSGNPYLLKTDGSGRELWKNIFVDTDIHTKDESSASSVQICSDNGYVMIGTHLIKTNANGEVYESDLMDKISSFVESKINTWQAKGEFEKTIEYQIRVTQVTRNTKIKNIQEEALVYFKKKYQKQINFQTITLNTYDADNETFLLDPFPLKSFLLAIPISEAPYFKQNFNSSNFSNVDFIIKDKKFILSHIDLLVGDKTYKYDISDNNSYATTKFDYNFDKIDIDIKESSFSNKIIAENKTIRVGKSLVDSDIPGNKKVSNRFALVIGNEDYTSFQRTLNIEQNVDYAKNDATIFKQYCLNTLGVKEENMYFLINATAGQMSQEIDLVSKILSKLGDEAELIVYYAGHGYPDELTKVPYLIPVDVSATNLSSAIKLSDMYSKLSKTNTSKISVFLDACFTGGGRNSGLVASRGVKVKPKEGSLSGNLVVFSASSGDQSSLPYHKEGHGMFTYHLLKKLQESQGNVSLGELSDYLVDTVSLQSLKENKKEQDPSVNISQKVIKDWRKWRF